MKTKKQREEEFRADLAALLIKHGAEISVTDDGEPWGLHSGIAVVCMQAVWDADGNMLADFTEFNL